MGAHPATCWASGEHSPGPAGRGRVQGHPRLPVIRSGLEEEVRVHNGEDIPREWAEESKDRGQSGVLPPRLAAGWPAHRPPRGLKGGGQRTKRKPSAAPGRGRSGLDHGTAGRPVGLSCPGQHGPLSAGSPFLPCDVCPSCRSQGEKTRPPRAGLRRTSRRCGTAAPAEAGARAAVVYAPVTVSGPRRAHEDSAAPSPARRRAAVR